MSGFENPDILDFYEGLDGRMDHFDHFLTLLAGSGGQGPGVCPPVKRGIKASSSLKGGLRASPEGSSYS